MIGDELKKILKSIADSLQTIARNSEVLVKDFKHKQKEEEKQTLDGWGKL